MEVQKIMYEGSNLKEALEYLVDLGNAKILDVDGNKYATKNIQRVKGPRPEPIEAHTLTALADYLKSGIDAKASEKLFVHVISPEKVALYSALRGDKVREEYMTCNALLPSNIVFDSFIDTERFNIMLQSSFVNNEDRKLLLQIVGTLQDKAVKEIGDDGVTQAVTIKVGVAQVGDAKVPNPVILAPYRTFPEVEQPESKFIFRMQKGPLAALFEADGGAWRNKAITEIKEYLRENLSGPVLKNIEILA
jgi:hypothetical protein